MGRRREKRRKGEKAVMGSREDGKGGGRTGRGKKKGRKE